ncbi:MAG: glycosyltransferase family 4 protein [Acidobacteria bacterium]|nr:glycosyltransferase family 4 protein [Acidobacteriota bacterium]
MKTAIVVQRYGADLSGGAEVHARYVTEHLSRHVEVEVLTTCARDYVSWRNDLPAGVDVVNGIRVRRFPVARERDIFDFADWSTRVFERVHSVSDELAWIESEGPTSTELVRHLRAARGDYDYFIFFSYRYYHAYHGIRAINSRSLLVPTAERDPAIGVSVFGPIFRGVRALMYNSFEERALIQAVSGNEHVPGVVVGVGSEVGARPDRLRFRQKYGIRGPFAIYVGRIDENKGCQELFDYFRRYANNVRSRLSLVLIGSSILDIPSHPRIRHLGYVSDEDKFDAIAAADVLIMPSYFESLSMVVLEAWALGRPVLANAHCDVLLGQSIRSNAGLFYENYDEFAAALRTLERDRRLADTLGRNGEAYYRRHYSWPVVERKYLDMIDRLKREDEEGGVRGIESLPSWFTRRRKTVLPAAEVLAKLPCGPVRAPKPPPARQLDGKPAARAGGVARYGQ